ncbi:MAG: NAD synthetase (EC [uncultured Campylobacterales bacterium]|uniref:NH(3)-dependent NAD(+) synthetase n=1 Tax=uncultured Campylobacterales bacterium TaxID=352960 RepID=A0A6S6T203_9BACT|nr:MAG: NAD synthetase (EC [uncultured Campylobacterales bacterium]
MNFKLIHKHLLKFLENEVKKTGLKNVVLGLSGGIDSAVVAVLAKEVFGSDLECIMMPASVSSKESLSDANELINKFDLNSSLVSIEPYIQTYKKENVFNNLELGNFMARIRMITLYDKSAKNSALVLGTSNKSELLLGYGTIYGDLASAINPIGDMYKTWIFGFAGYLGVPKSIIIKPPSADLREDQRDEADLGASD